MHEASDVHGVKIVDIRILHGTFVKQKLDQVEITLEGGPVQRCHVQLWRYVVNIGASLDENLDTFLAPLLRFNRGRFDALRANVPLVADEIKRGVPVLVFVIDVEVNIILGPFVNNPLHNGRVTKQASLMDRQVSILVLRKENLRYFPT